VTRTWSARGTGCGLVLLGMFSFLGTARALDGGGAVERTASAGVLAWALAAAILAAGTAITIALLREQLPDLPRSAAHAPAESPPDGLGAALAAAVRAGDARHIHAVACLFDLASRGHVQFELRDPERPKDVAAWSVRRARTPGEHASWERPVLAAVSAYPGEATAANVVWATLRARFGDFRAAVREDLHDRGDMDPAAGDRRRPFHVLALTAALLGAGGFAVAAAVIPSIGPAALAPAAACAMVAPIALAAATAVRGHTRQGALQASAVQAFRSALRSHTQRRAVLDADRFERCFAYAVALGLATDWMHAARRAKLAPPAWFGGPRSTTVPLAALEAQLVAAGTIEKKSASSAGAGA